MIDMDRNERTAEALIRSLIMDEGFRQKFLEDRCAVLERFELTELQREDLLRIDLNQLVGCGLRAGEVPWAAHPTMLVSG